MTRIAIYPGSFDPITLGHVNLIERGVKLFDQVIVVVAVNASKPGFLSTSERVKVIQQVFSSHKRISVQTWEGLTVDFARLQGAQVILRGVRAAGDYDQELQLANMNHCLATEIDTVLLPAAAEVAYISATIVREIIMLGGDISAFVPPAVVDFLNNRCTRGAKNY